MSRERRIRSVRMRGHGRRRQCPRQHGRGALPWRAASPPLLMYSVVPWRLINTSDVGEGRRRHVEDRRRELRGGEGK